MPPPSSPNGRGTTPNGGCRTDAVCATCEVASRGPGSTIEVESRPIGLMRGLAALRHRDFRLFWLSQLVSLIGTWMQILGQAWLVLQIGGSALDLGIVSALQFLPTLAFSLFGGLIADHYPKRYIILATQTAAMILAFVLAALTLAGIVTVTHVMILAVFLGVVNAVDMPTRQAYVVELVGRDDLPNAVALNSAVFNGARLVGPAIAGLLIGWLGLAPVFFLNGLSFLPVIVALLAMRAGSTSISNVVMAPRDVLENIKEGLVYVRRSQVVFLIVVVVSVVGTFGMNFNVVAPLFARDILGVGADGLGLLMSAMGLGALLASVMLAYLQWEPHPKLLVAGSAVFGLLEILLSRTNSFFLAALLLGAIGFAMIIVTTVANTTLQTSTPDRLRGRVMSVYTMVFVGTTPIGSLVTGYLAHIGTASAPLLVGGALSVAVAVIGWWMASRLRNEPSAREGM